MSEDIQSAAGAAPAARTAPPAGPAPGAPEGFRSDDGLVGKYLHADGSETAIKCVGSCDTVRDPATGRLVLNDVDRRKYSVFASSSVGCFMKCAFCYLTVKGARYAKIAGDGVLENLKEAVLAEDAVNPLLRQRYAKLCWMGMGEDHMLRPERTRDVTLRLLDWLLARGLARGLDGVDVSTVMPPGAGDRWQEAFARLDAELAAYPRNPNNAKVVHAANSLGSYAERSPLRLFYSLHSAVQETRDRLIPRALPLAEALPRLREFSDGNRRNVIFHQMFIDGANDSPEEVAALLAFARDFLPYELRVLRYNSCRNTPMHESPRFDAIVAELAGRVPRLKVQVSTGVEVRAACGQFIVAAYARPSA